MNQAQHYSVRMLEGARSLVAAAALLFMLFLGLGIGAFLVELLWPDHTVWALAILPALGLLLPAVAILLIRWAGLSSLSWPSVIGLVVIALVLLLDLFFGRSVLIEIWTREFGNTAEGVIVDHLAKPAPRNSTDYYVTYEFSAGGGSEVYTRLQNVDRDRYEALEIGTPVEIVYLPSKPTRSFLKESGLLRVSISMLLGSNLAGLFLFPSWLLVDMLFRRLIQRQEGSA